MKELPENPMAKYATKLERYKFVDGELWDYYPKTGTSIKTGNHIRERATTLRRKTDKKMYVNGKLIPQLYTNPAGTSRLKTQPLVVLRSTSRAKRDRCTSLPT